MHTSNSKLNKTARGLLLIYITALEKLFAKLKAMLRKAAKRTLSALWDEAGRWLDFIKPMQCKNYFKACGYITYPPDGTRLYRPLSHSMHRSAVRKAPVVQFTDHYPDYQQQNKAADDAGNPLRLPRIAVQL